MNGSFTWIRALMIFLWPVSYSIPVLIIILGKNQEPNASRNWSKNLTTTEILSTLPEKSTARFWAQKFFGTRKICPSSKAWSGRRSGGWRWTRPTSCSRLARRSLSSTPRSWSRLAGRRKCIRSWWVFLLWMTFSELNVCSYHCQVHLAMRNKPLPD